MKRLPKHLLILLTTFLLGVSAASYLFFQKQKVAAPVDSRPVAEAEKPVIEAEKNDNEEETPSPLENVWIGDERASYGGYTATKKCARTEEYFIEDNCAVKITKNKKRLAKFEASRADWVKYGFFDFLGNGAKQLIVFTYSGGAHCCYDYVIYDLQPNFRAVYDSRSLEADGEVGNELIPVDIDKDGVFEFQRSVMAFDYMSPSGHAGSTFPPAVFAFNSKSQKYEPANKAFPEYVLSKLEDKINGRNEWVKDNAKYGAAATQERLDEITVRETFLYWVYAGKEKEAWQYFDENYKFQFRDKFKKEFQEIFLNDPVYKSIYTK